MAKSFKKIGLKLRIILIFSIIAITPLTIIHLLYKKELKKIVAEMEMDHLSANNSIKKQYINNFYATMKRRVTNLSKDPKIHEACFDFQAILSNIDQNENNFNWLQNELYLETHDKHHNNLSESMQSLGFYDIYLILPEDGHVVYTAAKGQDFWVKLIDKSDILANTWRFINENLTNTLSDIDIYKRANETPTQFIGAPIIKDEQYLGIVVAQIPLDHLNKIMLYREGMGATGYSYLIGNDRLSRSDPFIGRTRYSIKNSLKKKYELKSKAVDEVLTDKKGQGIIVNHLNKRVLSAYEPIAIDNKLKWGIISEIEENEILSPIKNLDKIILATILATVVIICLYSIYLSRTLILPIRRCAESIKNAIDGKIEKVMLGKPKKEIKQLANGINETLDYIEKLQTLLKKQRSYLSSFPAPIFEINSDFTIQYINKSGAKLLNSSQNKLIGQKCYDTLKTPQCDPDKCICKIAMQTNKEDHQITKIRPNKEDNIPVNYFCKPLLDKHGNIEGAFSILIDLTEIYKLGSETKEATKSIQNTTHSLALKLNKIGTYTETLTDQSNQMESHLNLLKDQSKITLATTDSITSSLNAEFINLNSLKMDIPTLKKSILKMNTLFQESFSKQLSQANDKDEINEKSMDIKNSVNILQEDLNEVLETYENITMLASKSHLLALNATIEATKAGEAGIGLSAVAKDFKELAKEITSISKNTIHNIESIQKAKEILSLKIEKLNDTINNNEVFLEEKDISKNQSILSNNINNTLTDLELKVENITMKLCNLTELSQKVSNIGNEIENGFQSTVTSVNEITPVHDLLSQEIQMINQETSEILKSTENLHTNLKNINNLNLLKN